MPLSFAIIIYRPCSLGWAFTCELADEYRYFLWELFSSPKLIASLTTLSLVAIIYRYLKYNH
jgi:hypothetical protein